LSEFDDDIALSSAVGSALVSEPSKEALWACLVEKNTANRAFSRDVLVFITFAGPVFVMLANN